MSHLMRRGRRLALPLAGAAFVAVVVAAGAFAATSNKAASSAATPIKVAVLSDCQGAFGSFDGQDLAGVVSAMSEYAGAKPVNVNDPRKGWTGGSIGGHPLKLVGIGCSNDRADTAIKETKRLMEQLDADVMIGPLSGDESIAVANYAKQHPNKTFVDGSSGAQDTTLKVRAPNFFRFHGDGAMWNAGLGDLAYNKLGWKTAAVVADDYSFAWTSAAGFIAEFCAVGGNVTKRVFPPLNTTDYSSYAQQMPTNVDGTFVAVGGAGLIPFLKAYEQAHGPIDGKKFIGNLFWGTPGQFEQLEHAGHRRLRRRCRHGRRPRDGEGPALREPDHRQVVQDDPALRRSRAAGVEHVHLRLLRRHLGPDQGPAGGQGRTSAAARSRCRRRSRRSSCRPGYGTISLDKNRAGIIPVYYQQLYQKNGKLAVKTVGYIPRVDQTFGGTFSPITPAPGRTSPKCVKRSLPWIGKTQHPKVTG